jgi:hypothetical protein
MTWLVRVVVILGAALSIAIGILGLLAPASLFAVVGHSGEPVTGLTRQLADYVGARELVLGVTLLVLLLTRSAALPVVMIIFAASNALDGVDAVVFQRWAQVPGALFFAVAFLALGLWLLAAKRRQV